MLFLDKKPIPINPRVSSRILELQQALGGDKLLEKKAPKKKVAWKPQVQLEEDEEQEEEEEEGEEDEK